MFMLCFSKEAHTCTLALHTHLLTPLRDFARLQMNVDEQMSMPKFSPPDAHWNDLELIEYQQSTTKIDLGEIAVQYQVGLNCLKLGSRLNAGQRGRER